MAQTIDYKGRFQAGTGDGPARQSKHLLLRFPFFQKRPHFAVLFTSTRHTDSSRLDADSLNRSELSQEAKVTEIEYNRVNNPN